MLDDMDESISMHKNISIYGRSQLLIIIKGGRER